MADPPTGADAALQDQVVDAVITASRALVGVAVRSINAVTSDVTLPQHRALVLLISRGPQRIADLAGLLGVDPSTATRMAERLERRGLAARTPDDGDRRVVRLTPTDAARDLVAQVTRKRRAEVRDIVQHMPPEAIAPLIEGLRAFTTAAGEPAADGAPAVGWAP